MRSLHEINQEYSNVCSVLGDLEVKYQSEKSKLLQKIQELSKEANEAQQSEEVKE